MKFGTFTLPRAQGLTEVRKRIFVEKPLPDRNIAYRKDAGGYGRSFVVTGFLSGANREANRQTLMGLADGVARTFDEEVSGAPTVTCIMLDPQISKTVDKWGRIAYTVTFVQQSNP